MVVVSTRQNRFEHEGSFSSNRSFDDYNTDEIRRRWQLSLPPRARSLTRDEAREIIERQSSIDSYTGYTYGDSISYRSDGNVEYLHPYLNRRKYIDFGSGGDVTNYRPINVRLKPLRDPFHKQFFNWTYSSGIDFVEVIGKWFLCFFLVILKAIATVGMFIGSLVFVTQQKLGNFYSQRLKTSPVAGSALQSRSSRQRLRVSFASSPVKNLLFHQTSTPLTSTPTNAFNTPTPTKKISSKYFEPLHIYVWSAVDCVGEFVRKIFDFIVHQAYSVLSLVYIPTTDIESETLTPRRRGRPSKAKVAAVDQSQISIKSRISDGITWTTNKLSSAAKWLAFLFWATLSQTTSAVSYVQNNYASAQKSRNWWLLLLLLLLPLAIGLYGFHNQKHYNRDISTALRKDVQQVREWANAKANNMYGQLPSVSNLFGNVTKKIKNAVWGVVDFIRDTLSGVAQYVGHCFKKAYQWTNAKTSYVYSRLPSISKTFSGALGSAKNFSWSVVTFAGDSFSGLVQSVVHFFQDANRWIFAKLAYAYNQVPDVFGVFKTVVQKVKNFFWNVVEQFKNVIWSFSNGARSVVMNVVHQVKNFIYGTMAYFSDLLSGIASNFINFFRNAYAWTGAKLAYAYSMVPNISELFNNGVKVVKSVVWSFAILINDNVSGTAQHIVHFVQDAYRWIIARKNVYSQLPSASDAAEDEVKQMKNSAAFVDLSDVKKLIKEQISQYDADKTGQPDYALESSGGGIVGIGCTEAYEETSRQQSIFGIPLYFSNYSPRRRANSPTAGECWPYVGGHGQLQVKLSHKINVTSVSYEHLSPRLSPEGHIKTAPKEFRIWSIQNFKQKTERKHLLGEFVYADNDEALQTFETQFPDPSFTEIIELETLTNHGSPVTCLYRFRVHGQMSTNDGESASPRV